MIDKDLPSKWAEEGYAVVRGLFDPSLTARLSDICFQVLAQWRVRNPEKGEPGGGPESTVMRHLNHAGYFDRDPNRLRDLMHAIADDRVLGLVRTLLQGDPMFRCTSLFFNPLKNSRDGSWHRDTQFRAANDEEEREAIRSHQGFGKSVQLQIALAASDDVEYVPGSHLQWDSEEAYYIRKADGGIHSTLSAMPGAIRVALEPGDAVGFNPAGLHRGRYHTHPTRHTLMLTYTRQDVPISDYFSHQPWFLTPGYLDGLHAGARLFFDSFVGQYRADWV